MKKLIIAAAAVAMLGGMNVASASGDAIYKRVCFACHDTGAAGAPKVGDKAAWAPRIAKGMDALTNNTLNGINAMPPRGTCADCSDADLKGVVEYMVNNSK